jgi:spore coat protein CotH
MPRSNISSGFSMWYSFDIGQMHIISWSTEVLFARETDIQTQYKWIENDIINANKNRQNRRWIITIGHRPMYCSNADNYCIKKNSAGDQVRTYIESLLKQAREEISQTLITIESKKRII